jgi:Putative auto-transporter adhesin, head GIN domain
MSLGAFRRLGRRSAVVATAFVVVAATVAAGCSVFGVRGEGEMAAEDRSVGTFNRVDVGHSIALDLRIGSTPQVEIQAQPNILPLITTTVDDGRLVITSSDELAPGVKVAAVVVTPTLEGLGLSGSSHGTVAGLETDVLDLDLSGASRLDASGSAERVQISSSGGSAANLLDLPITTLDVDISGGSNVEARVSDEVSGSASGGARLSVVGDADVRVDTSGGATVDAG